MSQFTLKQEQLEQRHLLAANLLITEFMASNRGVLDDGDGVSSDWIEIHNAGDAAIDLSGYRLTDAADVLDKWTFPSRMIDPGGYLIVFASGQETDNYVDAGGNLHTNFRLGKDGEYLGLVAPDGTVVSEYGSGTAGYPGQLTDASYGIAQTVAVVTGASPAYYQIPVSDIGTAWTEAGFDAESAGFTAGTAALGLEGRPDSSSTFVGLFTTELPESAHAVRSRIEFDLASAAAISSMELKMRFDNGFVAYLNGQEVYRENAPDNVGWFSTAPETSPRDTLAREQTSFALTEHVDKLVDGENVLAFHGLNSTRDDSDMLLVPELVLGTVDMQTAFGMPTRVGFMTTPTPGSANVPAEQISDGFVGDVEMSVSSGYYDEPIMVELSHDTPNGQIVYTTDSSNPSATNGIPYTEPISIEGTTVLRAAVLVPEYIPGRIATNTYIYLDDILTQDGEGLPDTWGVLGSGCNNGNARAPARANYEMDPEVVNDPRYRDTLRDDLKAIPVMSLVLDPDDLWSEENGIYSNPLSEGFGWERPVNIELVGTDGETEFDVDAGIRIHGGWGRCPSQSNKHSLRVVFRNQYGDSKLRYPMFGDDAAQTFDTFVLRANFNHSWATGGDTATTFVNDFFAAQTQAEMGYVASRGTWVHLYLNGLYWGMYNPMERPSAPFAADYFGGDKDDYDVLVVGTPTDGDSRAWNDMMRLVRASEVDYEAVQEQLAIVPMIDYFIINQYGGNWDWPQNNWYGSRNREEPGSKWHFQSWDAEGMLGRGLAENRVNQTGGTLGELYRHLRDKVEEFRVTYADRIQKHFFNEGLLTPAANIDRLNRLVAPIDRAVVGESARWGDGRNDQVRPPRTRDDHWLPRLEDLRTDYFPERGDRVIEQFAAVGLWPDTAAPELSRHGGPIEAGFHLTMSSKGDVGTIYYTLDGTDPRLVGGDVAADAVAYSGEPITINDDALVKARVLNDSEWSPLIEAQFLVTGVRITEVNYHPHDPNPVPGMNEPDVESSAFEFVEIANVGSQPVDISGARISSGVQFEFPENSILPGNSRAVVVADTEAFQGRYGTSATILGEFTGDLSDFGEQVELQDAAGKSIARFVYSASGQFPQRAAGQGSTLELRDPRGGYSASNWTASHDYGGSPGAASVGGDGVVINEIVGYGDSDEVDLVELFNPSGQPVDISNWYVGDPASDPFRTRLGVTPEIAARGYHVLTETDLGFALDIGNGDRLALIRADENGIPREFIHQASFSPALPGIAMGAWPDRNGEWFPLAENTPGARNAGLRTGDLIVSEVNFDPADLDGDGGQRIDNWEFVELYNTTGETIDVSGWRISGGLDVLIGEDMTVGPDETLVFVRFNPTATTANVFKFIYGMDPTVTLAGRYRGRLDDEEGVVRIERPVDASDENTNFIYVDEMAWGTLSPFETGANQTGNSLHRRFAGAFGNAPSSWTVLPASPGSVEFTGAPLVVGDSNGDGVFNQLDIVSVLSGGKYNSGSPATFTEGDWNMDGVFNQLDIVSALQAGTYSTGNAALGLAKADTKVHDSVFADWERTRISAI